MIGILGFWGYLDSMFLRELWGSYGGGAGDAGVEGVEGGVGGAGVVDSKTLCFRGVLKIRLS